MEDKYFTIKEVDLNNNCPECYSKDGLKLTFKQKFVENIFYKAISSETAHTMTCHTCNTEIFPIRWNDSIERVFIYQQRALVPKAATFKLKQLAWILLVIAVIAIIVLNIYLFKG